MSERPTRILRVIARMNVGGPARQVIELGRRLAPLGFETVVATGKPEGWEEDLRGEAEEAGIRVVSIPGLASRVRAMSEVRALAALVACIRREKPDVVHTHTAKAGALGRLAAEICRVKRRVHTFHGTVFDGYFSPAKSRWVVRAERTLASLCERIVAVSHATADELEAAGFAKEKIRVIEPVIDLAPFASARRHGGALRAELRVAPDELLIGWIGRFVPIKEPLRFIEMAASLAVEQPKLRFVMLGAGPLLGEARARAATLGLGERIAFIGFRREMAPVYADLDLLVSTSRKEGMPVVVLEAMASAIPVVATAVGGAPELIADTRNGFLVQPNDAESLRAAVAKCLELPAAVRAQLGAIGRVRARERFGIERGIERHAHLYRELLAAR